MLTALGAVWINVKGEPGGVHTEPTAELPQAAADPTPGATLCRSKWTVPADVLKVTKSVTGSVPIVKS